MYRRPRCTHAASAIALANGSQPSVPPTRRSAAATKLSIATETMCERPIPAPVRRSHSHKMELV